VLALIALAVVALVVLGIFLLAVHVLFSPLLLLLALGIVVWVKFRPRSRR
jgi:hypothetical protein